MQTLKKSTIYKKLVLPKHWLFAVVANVREGWPSKDVEVIAVTGTNGKTSTCFLIHNMLSSAGVKSAVITTIGYGMGDNIQPLDAHGGHMSSLPAPSLLKKIKELKEQGVEVIVLEVTSHALSQYRTLGVPFSIGVFTNLTREHLDFHGSMEAYRDAKLKLFKKVARNTNGKQVGIANVDDKYGNDFLAVVPNKVGYSVQNGGASAFAQEIKLSPEKSSYNALVGENTYSIVCNLPGEFNVSNSLAAVCVGKAMGLDKKQIEQGIAVTTSVSGRMTRVDAGQDFDVIVDFAHTPDAIQNVLESLQKTTKGNVALVFGATGNRDTTKRVPMGEVAATYADKVYLTDDETYTENPEKIREAVMQGIVKAGGRDKTVEIGDRREAITKAFKDAKKGDVVVLAGLGHQPYREMASGQEPWLETEVAEDILETL